MLAQAVWNMRYALLFLLGPLAGLAIIAGTFGLPFGMRILACAMTAFSVLLFAVLIRGERDRLVRLERYP